MKPLQELIITPPKKKITNKYDIHPSLFDINFRLLIIAPSNSGKSVLLANLITSDEIGYNKIFKKNIFIFSSTIHMGDPAFSEVKNVKEDNIYNQYDEQVLSELMAEQEANIKEYGKNKTPHILIILDDLIHELPTSRRNLLQRLFYSGRHFNISLIILSQMYKSVEKAIRLNSSDIILFETGNNNEIKAIADEQAIDPKEFIRIYKDAVSTEYSFLVIHNKKPIKSRYQRRLSNYIYEIKNM